MAEIDIEVGPVRVDPLPVLATATDVTLLTGPARLMGWSLREAGGASPQRKSNSAVSPGAGANIVSIGPLNAGTYDVTWSVQLIGAAAAGDADNFRLTNGGAQTLDSQNLGAAGIYPQIPTDISVGLLGSISIQAIAAGTVGVTYQADLAIAPREIITASVEFQDGNQPLAESAIAAGGSDTQSMPRPGVHVRGQLVLHVVQGTVAGAVFAVIEPE
jgi:hypothetical protein